MSGERTRKALRERVLQVVQNTLDEHDADESLSIDEELTDAILAVLDADPDTPTADAPATCNSGTGGGETCALPRGHSGPHDPDAPHLDFSPENMARLREAALQNYIDTADAPADTDLRDALTREVMAGYYDNTIVDRVLPLVRAQVEAARRDTLTTFHAEVRRLAVSLAVESNWGGLSQTDYDEFLAAIDQAARGETRQP